MVKKVKVAIPTWWAQVRDSHEFIWLKGRVIEEGPGWIVVNCWNRKHNFRIPRLMCLKDKDDGFFKVKFLTNDTGQTN